MSSVFGGGGGHHQAGNASAAAAAAGLPFAGVPAELAEGVEKVTADEPEWDVNRIPFSHREFDDTRLTLRRLLRPHRKAVLGAAALIFVETASLQLGTFVTQIGIDKGVVPKDFGLVAIAAAVYGALILTTVVSSAARLAWTGRIFQRLLYDLRLKVFAHQLRLSLDFYTREKAGVIMSRMTADIEILNQFLTDGLVNLVIQGLTIVLVTTVLFVMNPELAAITIGLVVPGLIGMSLWFRSESARAFLRVRDGIAGVLSDLQESLAGVEVVTAHNRRLHNAVNHRNVVGDYREANDHTAWLGSVYGSGTDVLGYAGQAAVLLIGGEMVLQHSLTIGELTAFVLYMTAFFAPIQTLVQFYNNYQQAQSAITKLGNLLLERPTVMEHADAIELPPIVGEIRFEQVTFGYDPAVPVLRDVDLVIAPGETFALVGTTGAGKSTLAKLITRFYDPVDGRVLIDGRDIRYVQVDSLRRQLGVIPQEPFLFVGTLRDNIGFARPEASDEELARAAEAVGLEDLLERLGGLDAYVHERGSSLSSGERQLIALARALAAQPRVVVLDEATSNLDLQSETKVERALDVLLEQRTAVIIAHRLSTAMRANRIGVVHDGRMVEVGSHKELLAFGGRYADLYETWARHGMTEQPAAA
jgi:ATP-binding cassette subfamily B protein